MLTSTAGCASLILKVADKVGYNVGHPIGVDIARTVAPPKAVVSVEKKSGNACDDLKRLRWPIVATPEDALGIKKLSRGAKDPIVSTMRFGAAECGW